MVTYDELDYNDCSNKLNIVGTKETILLGTEDALKNNNGRSIVTDRGAKKLIELVWERFNDS
jgi:hypothetical protein